MGMVIKESKGGPRVRQPWYPEVAGNRGGRPYVNRRAEDGTWSHNGVDGKQHMGDWQKCKEGCR